MRTGIALCWVVTIFCTLGAVALLGSVLFARGISAPQEAAGAAMACALAIIPYVFTRALEGIKVQSDLFDRDKAAKRVAAERVPSPMQESE